MGGHAVLVDHEIALEFRRIHAPGLHLGHLLGVVVDALAAGGDLQPPEQQIEGQGEPGIGRVVHGVEGPLPAGVVGDEHEVAAPLLLGVPADVVLLLRLQIVGVADGVAVLLGRQPLHLVEADGGNTRHVGQFHPQQGQLGGIPGAEQLHQVPEEALLHLHHVGKGVDIAHLKVQGGVLVEMPLGGVLLRPEHRGHLVHPLEHPHHGLLVELGGLGQEGFSAKIVQAEDVGAPLRPGVDDLGGVDLGKALPVQVRPEGPADGGLDTKHRPLPGGAEHHRPQGQLRVQVQVQLLLGQGHRRGRGGPGEHRDPRLGQLHPAGGPGLCPQHAGDCDGALLGGPVKGLPAGAYTLEQPLPGAQGQEGDPAQIPQGVNRPVKGDGLVIPGPLHRARLTGQKFHAVHNLSMKKNKKSPEAACSFGTEKLRGTTR